MNSRPFQQLRSIFANWPLAIKLMAAVLTMLAIIAVLAVTTIGAALRRAPEQAGETLHTIAQSTALRVADQLAQEINNLDTLTRSQILLADVQKINAAYPEEAEFARQEVKKLAGEWDPLYLDNPLVATRLSLATSVDLRNFVNRYPESTEVFVTDRYGGVVSFVGGPPKQFDYLGETWWTLSFNGGIGAVYISPPQFDKTSSLYVITIAVPVFQPNEREVIGILHTKYLLRRIVDQMAQVEVGVGGEAMLMSQDGVRIDTTIDPESSDPEVKNNQIDLQEWAAMRNTRWRIGYLRSALSMIAQTHVITDSGPADINDLGWIVVIRQDLNRNLEGPLAAVGVGGIIGLVGLIVAIVFTIVVARALVRPITELTRTAKAAQGGDLEVRVPVMAQDEIGQLSEAFNAMISEIRAFTTSLEGKVAERTAQLAAINEITATVSSTLDIDEVLVRAVNLIRDRLGFYHVSVFLLDDKGESAFLRESTGDVGRQLKERGHRLAVGSQSIIGYVTANRKSRVALDVGADAIHFKNPLLPSTRSELGLPLIAGDTLLGALDVQSTQAKAFDPESINVLQNMANQIATAINNARFFQESQARLAEISQLNRQYMAGAWETFITTQPGKVGLRFEEGIVHAAPEIVTADEPITITMPYLSEDGAELIIPIILREQVIGEFKFNTPGGETHWSQDDVILAEAVIAQVALAVDNARLLEETRNALEQTQRLARRERVIAEVTDKISFGADVKRILQIAAEELRRATGSSRAVVRLSVPTTTTETP